MHVNHMIYLLWCIVMHLITIFRNQSSGRQNNRALITSHAYGDIEFAGFVVSVL